MDYKKCELIYDQCEAARLECPKCNVVGLVFLFFMWFIRFWLTVYLVHIQQKTDAEKKVWRGNAQ